MLRQVWSCRACCQWTDNWSPSQCGSVCFAGPPGTEPKSWIVALKMVVPNLYKWPWIFPHPLQAFSSHKPIWICLKIEDPQFKWVINVSHCLKIKQMAKHMINGSLVGQVTHKHPTSVPQKMAQPWGTPWPTARSQGQTSSYGAVRGGRCSVARWNRYVYNTKYATRSHNIVYTYRIL